MQYSYTTILSSLVGCSILAALCLTAGCDTSSSSSSSGSSTATAGDGFLLVVNNTARDFDITLTGANVLQTNETTAAGSQPMLSTNITTATDGVTMVTNVVNTPVATTVTNATVTVVTPDPIVRSAGRQQTTVIPLAPNTYRALFKVKTSQRQGEISIIIREAQRTQVAVLLDTADGTALQLSVSN